MKKYEYKLINTDAKGWFGGKINLELMNNEFNMLGQDGWELVEIIGSNQDSGNTRYVVSAFKREIEQREDHP